SPARIVGKSTSCSSSRAAGCDPCVRTPVSAWCPSHRSIELTAESDKRTMGKRTASETTLKPDPIYGNVLVSKFTNCLMWDGKKATAMRAFYGAMDQIKRRMPDANPL